MLPRLPRDLTIRLEPQTVELEADILPTITCRSCGRELTIHQPEPEFPESLLGTCGGCGAWHFVGLAMAGGEALFLLLPTVSLVRRALETDGAPGSDAPERAGGSVA